MIDFIVRLILGRSKYEEYLRQANETTKKSVKARQHALQVRIDAFSTVRRK